MPGSGRGADNFGEIELRGAGVAARDEDAADGVRGALPKSALTHLKIARILMKSGSEDGLREEIFNGAVSESNAISLGVAFYALAEFLIVVLQLANTGLKAIPSEFNRVEGTAGGGFELLAGRHGRRVGGVLQSKEIRQGKK